MCGVSITTVPYTGVAVITWFTNGSYGDGSSYSRQVLYVIMKVWQKGILMIPYLMTVITEQYLSNTASMLYWSYVINCGIWYFISWSSLYHVMSELNIYV